MDASADTNGSTLTDDKLLLTCFCYVFVMCFKQIKDFTAALPIIRHSVTVLQAPDTGLHL